MAWFRTPRQNRDAGMKIGVASETEGCERDMMFNRRLELGYNNRVPRLDLDVHCKKYPFS
jgi:hypothetical protein